MSTLHSLSQPVPMKTNSESQWQVYCEETIARAQPVLTALGYTLNDQQPHVLGERALTRPLDGARKLVLLGKRTKDSLPVVIKVSDEQKGAEELRHEHACREVIEHLPFAYASFPAPQELLFTRAGDFTFLVTEYLAQDTTFLARPLLEQFTLLLKALKAQESVHATTYEHQRLVRKTFGTMSGTRYGDMAHQYESDSAVVMEDEEVRKLLSRAVAFLEEHADVLEQYGDFLTHWDFTPQNFRVHDETLHFLDLSSLRFGNKYEGWARLINFMVLYNPPLAAALIDYVRLNRAPEEMAALTAMRVYRLLELVRYYTTWLPRTEGDLLTLTHTRITFWLAILTHVLDGTPVPPALIEQYTMARDRLRSEDEKVRQHDLH